MMWRAALAVAMCAGLAAGGWWLHHTGFRAGQAACEAVHEAAQAQAERQHAADLRAAEDMQSRITHTGDLEVADSIEASHETVRYIIRTVREHPAPAGCIAPADSVQRLRAAVRETNAAAGGLRSEPASAASADDP